MPAPATSRENGKRGGRPPGRLNNKTIERELQLERLKQRVFAATDVLVNAQLSLAQGVAFLYRIDGDDKQRKPVLVTDQEEIEAYLSGEYKDSGEYHYITTERPDNKAIDSLLDRAYGKAQQNVDITSGGKTLADLMREVHDNGGGDKPKTTREV